MGEMNPLIAIPKVSNKGTKVEYEVSELIQCKDVDKVVKGLGLCSSGDWNSPNRPCTDCPYYPAGYTGCAAKPLMRDALALILEQLGKINKLSMLAKADGIDVDKLFEHEEGRTVMTDHDKERYQEYMDKYRENKRKTQKPNEGDSLLKALYCRKTIPDNPGVQDCENCKYFTDDELDDCDTFRIFEDAYNRIREQAETINSIIPVESSMTRTVYTCPSCGAQCQITVCDKRGKKDD